MVDRMVSLRLASATPAWRATRALAAPLGGRLATLDASLVPWIVVIGLVAGCSRQLADGSADGAKVFEAACATCHGPTGKPPEALQTQLGVRDLTAPELRARMTQALIEHQIRMGSENQRMPAFQGALSDAQIAAVAAFVMQMPAATP